jgi:deoxyribodipyrimidine photolyase-related protein
VKHYSTLRLILGDQLNAKHSWYAQKNDDVVYVIAELKQEAQYVNHHIQKMCGFFAAMAAFAARLSSQGHAVQHLTLDESVAYKDLPHLIQSLCSTHSIKTFEYQQPDEYRLAQQLLSINLDNAVQVRCCDTEHFLLPKDEIGDYINAGKHNRMEFFYRKMRKRFVVLMDDDQPQGGQWNFDGDNRKKLKSNDIDAIPQPLLFSNDVSDIVARIGRHNLDCIGNSTEALLWPINHEQSQQLLHFFCQHCLPSFGRFQDAMTRHGESRWSLYHARISFALNSKILHPMEVIETALSYFFDESNGIDLAQIEGFVRQILGWREYIRAVYWVNMPEYASLNALSADRPLPGFFWNGDTRMTCVKQAIDQSLDYAYAHHIQRLMITGNFAMLAGIDPDAMDQWYLGIYIDAVEWVEMPNTRGMSQFADGGIIATKPYAASGSYINKMSDYCGDCYYSVKERYGDKACPFNSLYWHFMQRHKERFARNPRTAMAYRSWDKMDEKVQQALLDKADYYLANIEDV